VKTPLQETVGNPDAPRKAPAFGNQRMRPCGRFLAEAPGSFAALPEQRIARIRDLLHGKRQEHHETALNACKIV
jgi:hypothetical protein